MKHEKLIVVVLSIALAALAVATVFASRVPPKLLPMQTVPTRAEAVPAPAPLKGGP